MILGLLALALLVVATLLLSRLHALPTGVDPASGAVSDYGTTEFHNHYRAMVVALGLAAAALALGLAIDTDAGVALVWLWLYAASRVAIAAFMTDADAARPTREGRVHVVLAAVAFTSIAFAAPSVSWTGEPSPLDAVGAAVAVTAVATLVTYVVPRLRSVFGIAERLLYLTSIAWLMLAAADLAS